METETNTWSCSSETFSTFNFTLDYNTWIVKKKKKKKKENSDTPK